MSHLCGFSYHIRNPVIHLSSPGALDEVTEAGTTKAMSPFHGPCMFAQDSCDITPEMMALSGEGLTQNLGPRA